MAAREEARFFVTYATPSFFESQNRLVRSAEERGFGAIRAFNSVDLQATAFYAAHREILQRKSGGGYFLWKPYYILQVLREMREGDLLLYVDSGCTLVGDPTPLLDLCREQDGILLFHNPYDDIGPVQGPAINRIWTKRDCFLLMNCDEPRYHEARQVDAAVQVYQKNARSLAFVEEFLEHSRDARIVTDWPNTCGLPDLPGFVQNRYDQSVLSLLAEREGIERFRSPTQWANHLKLPELRVEGEWLHKPYTDAVHTNSPYPTLVEHHRIPAQDYWLFSDGREGEPRQRSVAEAVARVGEAQRKPLRYLELRTAEDGPVAAVQGRTEGTHVCVEGAEGPFEDATWSRLAGEPWNVVFLATSDPAEVLRFGELLEAHPELLDGDEFAIVCDALASRAGVTEAFVDLWAGLRRRLSLPRDSLRLGRALRGGTEPCAVGLVLNLREPLEYGARVDP